MSPHGFGIGTTLHSLGWIRRSHERMVRWRDACYGCRLGRLPLRTRQHLNLLTSSSRHVPGVCVSDAWWACGRLLLLPWHVALDVPRSSRVARSSGSGAADHGPSLIYAA